MIVKKMAFIGSVGSGKTTIVEKLSSVDTINTDVASTMDIDKTTTTVGIDYGQIVISEQLTLALYGVPGQKRFSIVWDFVKEGLWSVVILIKNKDVESINDLGYLIKYFEVSQETPFVIGVTHSENNDTETTFSAIRTVLNDLKLSAPIFSIDPRRKSSSLLIMDTIIALEEA